MVVFHRLSGDQRWVPIVDGNRSGLPPPRVIGWERSNDGIVGCVPPQPILSNAGPHRDRPVLSDECRDVLGLHQPASEGIQDQHLQDVAPAARDSAPLTVPGEGFEPPTFGLQNRCTTTVLTRQFIVFAVFFTRRSDAELNAFVEHVQLVFFRARCSRPIAPLANASFGRT